MRIRTMAWDPIVEHGPTANITWEHLMHLERGTVPAILVKQAFKPFEIKTIVGRLRYKRRVRESATYAEYGVNYATPKQVFS